MSDTYKILIVNDDEEQLDVTESLLKNAGYKILRATDGREALSVASEEFPDLIVSDVIMPEGGGIELCRLVREDLKLRLIPILLISAVKKDVKTVVEALSVGADDYIEAPYHELHLIAKIARLVESKRLERINAEREFWFQSLIENISDIITVMSFDGTITFESPSIERVLGYNQDELLGKNAFDFIHPEDHSGITHYFLKAIQSEDVSKWKDYRFRHKDGTWRILESIGKVFKDPRDGYVALITSRDTTERKQSELLLNLLESSVRQTNEAVVITNSQLEPPGPEIIFVNPAFTRMTGYAVSELIGRSPRILQGAKTDREMLDEIKQCLYAGKECHGEVINYRKDKTEYRVECNISPIRNEAGEITHFVSVQQDVTRRRQLERQHRQLQRMEAVGQLAGGIAHDFNNMLTAILGYSDLTLRKLGSDDPLRSNIEEIARAAERSASITKQLLTFSRNQPYQPKILELNKIVADIEAMLARIVGENIELKTNLAPTGRIKADQAQIEQVLVNLVVNARDAMPNGGKVLIETEYVNLGDSYSETHPESHKGEYVRLTISDTGTGMDAETQAQIFEPFFTTKEPGKGTGLGLSTVYGIVKQAGGFITVYSEAGFGSIFKIYLPRVEAAPEAPAATDKIAALDRLGNETILLVEDEETLRNLAREILEANGFQVLTAASGEEALRRSDEFEGDIHLLLTDVVMPQMSGAILAEKLIEKRPLIRVLFMSGYTRDLITQPVSTGKEIEFIGKPFSADDLTIKVLTVLGK